MDVDGTLTEVASDSRGHILYRELNGVGGYRYWSDEIGGGVVVWDTSLVSNEMMALAIKVEAHRAEAEKINAG